MKPILICCLLIFSVLASFSQENEYPHSQKSTFVFTIENIIDQPQLDKLQSDVEKIKGVSEVKTIFKTESGKGQLIFTYTEEITGTENKENIDLVVFKNIILSNQLGFVDFKIK